MDNRIELEFADGIYLFALPLAQIGELQRKTDCGIGALYSRTLKGAFANPLTNEINLSPVGAEFYAADLIETIRQGLIGGGKGTVNGEEVKVTPVIANKLIDGYVLNQPLMDAWKHAAAILGACIVGYDPPKKELPADERAASAKPKRKRKGRAGSTSTEPLPIAPQ